MKTMKRIFLFMLLFSAYTTMNAQGISVHMKDGTSYNVSNEVFDSIANYYDEGKTGKPTGIKIFRQSENDLLVPYELLDYIGTYDYDDAPDEHPYIDLGRPSVDLGLPSGILWATCNVGAEEPTDYGDYFAWGETTGLLGGKTYFDFETYKWSNGGYKELTKYCNSAYYGFNGYTDSRETLEPDDDAATANWGGDWRMPTKTEWNELKQYCTWTWKSINGVSGYKVESNVPGYEGNYIFLPAGGYYVSQSKYYLGDYGYYWSSTRDKEYWACGLTICYWSIYIGSDYDEDIKRYTCSRKTGQSVRAVLSPQKTN